MKCDYCGSWGHNQTSCPLEHRAAEEDEKVQRQSFLDTEDPGRDQRMDLEATLRTVLMENGVYLQDDVAVAVAEAMWSAGWRRRQL